MWESLTRHQKREKNYIYKVLSNAQVSFTADAMHILKDHHYLKFLGNAVELEFKIIPFPSIWCAIVKPTKGT